MQNDNFYCRKSVMLTFLWAVAVGYGSFGVFYKRVSSFFYNISYKVRFL